MLKTCKLKDFKQEYENLLFDNFSESYQKMRKDGHIPEEMYKRMGVPPDMNYDGDEVDKPDKISQEMRHRARILSHDIQCKLRKKKEDAAVAGLKKKRLDDLVIAHDLHIRNDEAMKKIIPTGDEPPPLEDLPLTAFKGPNLKQLKAFVQIRLFNTATIPNGQGNMIPKNKGSVDAVATGAKNLIGAAYDCRNMPIILPRPQTNDDGEVILDEDKEGSVDDEMDDIEVVEDNDNSGTPLLIVECPHKPIVTPPHQSNEANPLPSHYLTNSQYLSLAKDNIKGVFMMEITSVTEEKKNICR